MPDNIPFSGFEEPRENFYRLPNNWFSEVLPLLRTRYGERIAAPLKMLEYILRHTWGRQEWSGQLRLSANEIRNGRKRGSFLDSGTGISENTVKAAGDILEELGLITITQDTVDKARRYKTYAPRIISPTEKQTSEEFCGFVPPISNYFILPNNWTDMTKDISSGATIAVVEYAIRHAWGYSNDQGSWMRAEEFAYGREYKTTDRRYDAGTGFDIATIYRALDDAVKRGLMVYAEYTDENYYTHKVYNLRLASMIVDPETGTCLQPLPADFRTVEDNVRTFTEDIRTIEVQVRTVAEEDRTVEDVSRTVEANIHATEDGIRTIQARSLIDTKTLDTKIKKPTSTTSHSATSKKIPTVVTDVELPLSILAGLEQIAWADTLTEVQNKYAENPDRVHAWLNFAVHAPHVQQRAGLFRKGIRSGGMPPYQIKVVAEDNAGVQEQSENEQDDSGYAIEPVPIQTEADQAWESVQNQLQLEMPRAQFNIHVKPARAISLSDNTLQVDACNPDRQEWLENRVRRTAENILIGILNRNISIQFVATQ